MNVENRGRVTKYMTLIEYRYLLIELPRATI